MQGYRWKSLSLWLTLKKKDEDEEEENNQGFFEIVKLLKHTEKYQQTQILLPFFFF